MQPAYAGILRAEPASRFYPNEEQNPCLQVGKPCLQHDVRLTSVESQLSEKMPAQPRN